MAKQHLRSKTPNNLGWLVPNDYFWIWKTNRLLLIGQASSRSSAKLSDQPSGLGYIALIIRLSSTLISRPSDQRGSISGLHHTATSQPIMIFGKSPELVAVVLALTLGTWIEIRIRPVNSSRIRHHSHRIFRLRK